MNTKVDPGRVPVQGFQTFIGYGSGVKNVDNSVAMAKVIIWLLCILSVVFFCKGRSDSTSEVRILYIYNTNCVLCHENLDFSSSSCSEKDITSKHGIS